MLKLALIFFLFFPDEKLEDLKAQKRKIVSDAVIYLLTDYIGDWPLSFDLFSYPQPGYY